MAQLNAYLFFQGNAAEAMHFYQGIFGGDLNISKVGDGPMAEHMPEDAKNHVMHSVLNNPTVMLMGSDMMEDGKRETGNVISLALICDTEDELKDLFNKLSEGGNVTQELKKEYFGWFGTLNDKYGIRWMFQQGGEIPEK